MIESSFIRCQQTLLFKPYLYPWKWLILFICWCVLKAFFVFSLKKWFDLGCFCFENIYMCIDKQKEQMKCLFGIMPRGRNNVNISKLPLACLFPPTDPLWKINLRKACSFFLTAPPCNHCPIFLKHKPLKLKLILATHFTFSHLLFHSKVFFYSIRSLLKWVGGDKTPISKPI